MQNQNQFYPLSILIQFPTAKVKICYGDAYVKMADELLSPYF